MSDDTHAFEAPPKSHRTQKENCTFNLEVFGCRKGAPKVNIFMARVSSAQNTGRQETFRRSEKSTVGENKALLADHVFPADHVCPR